MSAVLVTGAGSGIGAATALRLDRLGMRVFAAVHDTHDGEILAKGASASLSVHQYDATDQASVRDLVGAVDTALGTEGLTAVVNVAGAGVAGPLELLAIDDLRHQLDVDVVGPVAVTQLALPLLRRAEGGRVVFVGAAGSLVSMQLAGAYHASKYAVEAISDAWRQELAAEGISVCLVEPGPVATPLWSKALQTLDRLPASDRYADRVAAVRESLHKASKNGESPHKVAEQIEHAVTAARPKSRYPVGAAAHVVPRIRRLLPDRLFDRAAQRIAAARS
ncbi:short-chain dehydrogenase/reductase SDR [Kribbella flavida DSM 17836]|uniref:Short-chain dehydrogenase/reductase SDR n=1 Tax=Kribbella flavida (strain DSM 17836 / JCM 10339 / NBRC 14399) TaxID=479435 RepID=D2PLK9_KRIFD|nr:SDR family NAD(P)-dependent oxidoreductase [Kribbella flavida]ADB30638.1 short-chain dehydrogenase/reductase SDR [Kribbella flavida DSM 17836]